MPSDTGKSARASATKKPRTLGWNLQAKIVSETATSQFGVSDRRISASINRIVN
jgi:hypothetical protein